MSRLSSAWSAMLQVAQDLQAFLNDVVAAHVIHVGHKTNAAGIMLAVGVVKALCAGRPVEACARGRRVRLGH